MDKYADTFIMNTLEVIESLNAKIAVIEPRAQERLVIMTALRHLGFTKFSPVKTYQELDDSLLQRQDIHWVLVSTEITPHQDTIAFLDRLAERQLTTLVSTISPGRQISETPLLYGSGLLSSHKTDWNAEHLKAELRLFLKRALHYHYSIPKLALSYLREILEATKQYQELLHLETMLSQQLAFPEANHMEHAHALQLCGQNAEALRTFHQAAYYHPKAEQRITQISAELTRSAGPLNFAQQHNISRAVWIGDESEQKIIKDGLLYSGIEDFHSFTAPKQAWQSLQDRSFNPDLIILNWPEDPGAHIKLFQRLYQIFQAGIPIIVISYPLAKAERQLLQDLKVHHHIVHPYDAKKVLKDILHTIKQTHYPTEPKTLENSIIYQLRHNHYLNALLQKQRLDKARQKPKTLSCAINGLMLYIQGQYHEAIQVLKEGYHLSGQRANGMAILLGYAFSKIGKYEAAVKVWSHAVKRSPLNIVLYCNLSDAYLMLGQVSQAKTQLIKARDIDPHNPRMLESYAKFTIAIDQEDKAFDLLDRLENSWHIFQHEIAKAESFMMAKAYDKALKVYQKSLHYMTDSKSPLISKLLSGAAQACLKCGEEYLAKVYMKRIARLEGRDDAEEIDLEELESTYHLYKERKLETAMRGIYQQSA